MVELQTNVIYCGDCLDILKGLPNDCVDLIYLDPPFFSQKHYEVLWGDGAELRAFQDRWKGGINHYVEWMKERLEQCKRILKDTGSIYLHCDWHASHYLKVTMDGLFGENNLRNEIVWQRTFAHGGATTGFSRVHDVILFYSKSDDFVFNRLHQPYSEHYIRNFFTHEDKKGRYRLVIATGSGETKSDYAWKGVKATKGRHWAYTKEKMEQLEKEGRLVYSKSGMPSVKQYLTDKEGTLVTDIWTDIEVIHSQSKERLGYPTQKPLALLDRIINASSNKNDIVLDPFCGCGTSLVSAFKNHRRFIGIDVSPTACKLMARRLRGEGVVGLVIQNLPTSIKQLEKLPHFEFQNWVCQQLNGKVSARKSCDRGIDGWILGTIPIQVKQSEDVGRNPIDNFETAIRRENKKQGVFVAFSFGKGAEEEKSRAKLKEGLNIKLLTVEDILKPDFNPMELFSEAGTQKKLI